MYLVKHLRLSFLWKSAVATKANSKPYETFEMELFPQALTSYRGEFRIFPNNYGGALVFLLTICYFEECNESICLLWYIFSKDRCFYRYLHILTTVFFNPGISNQMSLIVISVDYSSTARGKQRGRFASNNHC